MNNRSYEKWNIGQKNEFVQQFINSYNKETESNYILSEEGLKDKEDFDFCIVDGEKK